MKRGYLKYIIDNPQEAWLAIVFLALGGLFLLAALIRTILRGDFEAYHLVCLIVIGSGVGILSWVGGIQHPLATVAAIALIALGLFLLIFKGRDAHKVHDAIETSRWWNIGP